MAFTCIPADKAKKFIESLKNKDIQIADLLKMSTEERTKVFEQFAGDQAQAMNLLFEEKLVLKNKVQGLKNFIAKVGQEKRYNPENIAAAKEALAQFREKQQQRIFSPAQNEAFLNDLADKIVGAHITREQSDSLFALHETADKLFQDGRNESGWKSPQAKAEYGAAKVMLENFTEDLKFGKQTIRQMLADSYTQFKDELKTNKPLAVAHVIGKVVRGITDNTIALVASLDNSFIGRQGLKTLFTHPTVWWPVARASIVDFAKTIGGENMKDALRADIYSSENYINGSYDLAKLIPKYEEQYPGQLPERVPGLGRAFKASETAFENSAIRMRTGLYDLLAEKAKEQGVDMTDKYQIESIGKLVNSLTARGSFGRGIDESTVTKVFLWAPRMLKANIDVLTAHAGQDISPFARKQAALNLAKIVATTAGVMAIANAIQPGSAELDPRSSDFGKIKIGNTRFDITGGAGSLLVLAARQISGASKSTSTGLVKSFGTGFGQQTRFDTIISFLTNKTPPVTSAVIAMLKGTNYAGQPITPAGLAQQAVVPISIQNAIQLKDDNSAQAVLGVMLDALGINANTYASGATDWSSNPSAELQAFQAKVGDAKFTQANDKYNQEFQTWLTNVQKDPRYSTLSDDDKQRVLTSKRSTLRSQILGQYGFRYRAPRPTRLPRL